MRILIADDEQKVRQLIRLILEKETFSTEIEIVGEARNGSIALSMIEQARPDVVITDIRMPGYTGLELIREARECSPSLSFIIISGYELFEYAHEAIKYGVEDYLLKPIKKNELLQAVNRIIEKRTAHSAQAEEQQKFKQNHQQLLLQRLMQHEPLCAAGRLTPVILRDEYYCTFTGPQYMVVLLKADAPEIFENQPLTNFLSKRIEQAIARHMTLYAAQMLYSIERDTACFLFSLQPDDLPEIRKSLKQLVFALKAPDGMLEDIHVTIAVGKPIEDIAALPEGFATAEFAIKNRLLRGVDTVLDGETPNDMLDIRDVISTALRKKLITDIEYGNTEPVLEAINRLSAHVMAAPSVTGRLIYRTAAEVLDLAMFALKNELTPEEQAKQKHRVMDRLNLCTRARDIFSVLCRMLMEIFDRRQMLKKQQEARPIEAAKRYVRMYYEQSISLDEVGEQVGLSPTYLSSLFKKETGMAFSEFLTETRIHAACDLLLSTNRSISDITEAVGYNDVKYFTKVFKKVTNLSPTAYRKLYY